MEAILHELSSMATPTDHTDHDAVETINAVIDDLLEEGEPH